MKKQIRTWAIAICALFIVMPSSFAAKGKAEHVILVSSLLSSNYFNGRVISVPLPQGELGEKPSTIICNK